jgi:hypothetical protein
MMPSRYRLAALAALLVAFSVITAARAEDATSCAAADGDQATAATRAGIPITIEGAGQSQSLPFSLGGGAYTVAWSTQNERGATSYMLLNSAEDPSPATSQQIMFESGHRSGGETHIYHVKPGRYYLSVNAPASWTVTFTPITV